MKIEDKSYLINLLINEKDELEISLCCRRGSSRDEAKENIEKIDRILKELTK